MTGPIKGYAEKAAEYEQVELSKEPLTPVEIERELARLYNAIAKNQVRLMTIRTEEIEAKIAFEKAHLRATMSGECPKVKRGGTTVAERDDWIRDKEFEEYEAYEVAKKRTRNCRDYNDMLQQQCSLVQSMNRSVVASYWQGNGGPGKS